MSAPNIEDLLEDEYAKLLPPRVVSVDWKKSLLRSESGSIKPLLANAIAALRHAPPWQNVLGFDEFAVRTVTLRAAPWNPSPHAWNDTERR